MSYKKLFLKAACLIVVLFNATHAYSDEDGFVEMVMKIARDNITNAKLLDGSFVPPETEEEKKQPIIPIEEAELVVEVGQQSGIASWCHIEWEEASYRKLMIYQRSRNVWSEKQIAYIGFLHGVTMGLTERTLKERGSCSKKQAEHTSNQISKRRFE